MTMADDDTADDASGLTKSSVPVKNSCRFDELMYCVCDTELTTQRPLVVTSFAPVISQL
jgi:hypothetical protein